jgi:FkbM family methyltransferase
MRPIDLARRTRRFLHELAGRDVRTRVAPRADSIRLGTEYGGWDVVSSLISPDSIVYSFGVGHDISFDLGMIERFGVTIHAFDPTPAVAEFIARTQPPAKFVFHPVGLAGHDGELRFKFQQAERETLEADASGEQVLQVNRLQTLLNQIGHRRIDVLKVDIEGSEHAFLDDLVANPVPIGQLLIEFHHAARDPASVGRVRRSLDQLSGLGFELFARTPVGKEFSFVHRDARRP